MTDIRQVSGDERLHTAFTLYPYAFDGSPEEWSRALPYHRDNHTLIAEEDGRAVATASAFAARQNLRGTVQPMAGIAWVATHPGVRRHGHSSRLMHRLHSDMLDKGHVLATLFPFHPAFYEKFGYVGLPLNRTATLRPEELPKVRLPGEVTWQDVREGYETYRAFLGRLLPERHGFTVTPDYRAARLLDATDRWIATATLGGEVLGVLIYRIDGYGGCLHADEMLYVNALGRGLLLRFLAQHAYQVSRIVLTVAPDEFPETWATSLTVRTEAEASYPTSPPLMGRLLSMDALRGVRCGAGRVEIELVDDDLLAGRYLVDGTGGTIDVGAARGSAEKATLTAAGLSGLAYGVLDPYDVVARGLGDVPDAAARELAALLPRQTPHAFGKG